MSREKLEAFRAAKLAVSIELEAFDGCAIAPVPAYTDEQAALMRLGGLEMLAASGDEECCLVAVKHAASIGRRNKAAQVLATAKNKAGFDKALAACQRALPAVRKAVEDAQDKLDAAIEAEEGGAEASQRLVDAQQLLADYLRELGPFALGPGGRP